jgi:ribosomal protein S16
VKDWLSKGAQPSDAVSRLLKAKNIEAEGKGAGVS